MGVSIHKVAKEKLHKQNKPECGLATATMEAYIDERLCEEVRKYNCSMKEYKDIYMGFNSWREIAPGEVLQFGAKRMCRTSVYAYESNEVYFA